MERLLTAIGRLFTLAGKMLACLAIAVVLSTVATTRVPTGFMEDVLSRLASISGTEFSPMDPDELVYDYTLSANMPRIYIIRIPGIDLEAPVVKVGETERIIEGSKVRQTYVPHAFAVGWNEMSAPVGSPGNTIFVGHNNIYGEVFRDLWNLQPGDQIFVQTGTGERAYVVSDVATIDESSSSLDKRIENARWIQQTPDEQLTLITCFPYSSNTHRLVVVAHPG